MIEEILGTYEDETFSKPNGFDDAIIGVDSDAMRLIYSVKKCIEILQASDGMSYSEAMDYFSFNVSGTKSSDNDLPIWCEDDFGVADGVELSFELFTQMQKDIKILRTLQGAGVDNWDGYDEAMESIEDEVE